MPSPRGHEVDPLPATGGHAEATPRPFAPGGAGARAVARYYDYMTPYYRLFWHGRTGAVHYGLRGDGARGRRQELLNTNRVLADAAEVGPGDHVLDAGCGVGGSATWLAEHRDARVTGITLSERQVHEAQRRAAASGTTSHTRFLRADYCATGFEAETFDVVWALESSCYAGRRTSFVREALRLLRRGGRLVIGDGLRTRRVREGREGDEYRHFTNGLVLPDLQQIDDLVDVLETAGFERVHVRDVTDRARPSSRRLYRACRPAYRVARLLGSAGLMDPMMTVNARAGIAQYHLVNSGLVGYFVVTARKPDDSTASRED